MGYWIRVENTSSTWSRAVLLLVGALIAGFLGMHVLDGHGSATTDAAPPHHAMSTASMASAPIPAGTTAPPTTVDAVPIAVVGDGCGDCAGHAAMTEACVLALIAPAALPAPPAEDHRPAAAPAPAASAANDPADPRPPRISALCISRR